MLFQCLVQNVHHESFTVLAVLFDDEDCVQSWQPEKEMKEIAFGRFPVDFLSSSFPNIFPFLHLLQRRSNPVAMTNCVCYASPLVLNFFIPLWKRKNGRNKWRNHWGKSRRDVLWKEPQRMTYDPESIPFLPVHPVHLLAVIKTFSSCSLSTSWPSRFADLYLFVCTQSGSCPVGHCGRHRKSHWGGRRRPRKRGNSLIYLYDPFENHWSHCLNFSFCSSCDLELFFSSSSEFAKRGGKM